MQKKHSRFIVEEEKKHTNSSYGLFIVDNVASIAVISMESEILSLESNSTEQSEWKMQRKPPWCKRILAVQMHACVIGAEIEIYGLNFVVFVGNYSRLVSRSDSISPCNSFAHSIFVLILNKPKFQCVFRNNAQCTHTHTPNREAKNEKKNEEWINKVRRNGNFMQYSCVYDPAWIARFIVNFRIKNVCKSKTCPFELNVKWIRLWLADILLFKDLVSFSLDIDPHFDKLKTP